MDRKYKIQQSPNWHIEAIGFIMEVMTNRVEMIKENHNIFGKTRDELEVFFNTYIKYKNKLSEEILPIYKRYSRLNMIFQMEEKLEKNDLDLALSLIQDMEQRYERPLSNENIDELVQQYILNKIDNLKGELGENQKIVSLSNLIELLEKSEISDGEKMFLISLYQNKYEIIREIEDFTEEVKPILQQYYSIIEDEYNKSIRMFKEIEDFKALIEEIVPMKLIMNVEGDIIFTIFPFGGLYLKYHEGILMITIGIYILLLKKWKEQKGFQGAELVTSLKALGDATRLSILNKIGIRPMYIQELSEELNLTPATISHHINILLKSQLVNLIVEADAGKKIFYEINKEKLRELGSIVQSLGEENTRGLDFSGKTAKISIS